MNFAKHFLPVLSKGVLVLILAPMLGCKGGDDLPKAKASVETSLNSWKKGELPQQLTSQGIEMSDADWDAGLRLLDFTVKSATSLPQQGPRVVVQLSMQDKGGKKVDTEVAYEVLLKDKAKIKIGRDAFHVGQ